MDKLSQAQALCVRVGMIHMTDECLRSQICSAIMQWGDYKVKEEQGRLVVLPCKIGERVYKTYNKYNASICTCCMDMAGLGCECAYWDEEKYTCTNRPDRYGDYGIASVGFDYRHIPELDKTVFLTPKSAESALKTKFTGGD